MDTEDNPQNQAFTPPEVPAERHHDEDLDQLELTDDLNLEPDFEAEEIDEADEVFEDEDDAVVDNTEETS